MKNRVGYWFRCAIKCTLLFIFLSSGKCDDKSIQLTTSAATDITGISAKTGGEIIDVGDPPYTERGVCYGIVSNPGVDDNKVVVAGSGTGVFSTILSGLNPNTKYYVRAYAINSASTAYGNQVDFSTEAGVGKIAELTTSTATDVTTVSAKTGGNITDAGDPPYTERGVCYGIVSNPGVDDNKVVVAGSGTGVFSTILSGLNPNTKYYVRAYAVNSVSTAYGNQIDFITDDDGFAKLITSAPTGITATSAKVGGNITNEGNPPYIERGVCYSISPTPTVNDKKVSVTGSGTGIFSIVLTELEIETTYFVRAYATSSKGTVYGNQVDFTTIEPVFPDDNFHQYLLDNFDNDPKDGILSKKEIMAVTRIDCSNKNISSLEGIQYFSNLKELCCDDNKLTSLDVSKCSALTELSCIKNKLPWLNVRGCSGLIELYCNSNLLTWLDATGCNALEILSCRNNKLASLDLKGCDSLTELWCFDNQLTSLDVSGCSKLNYLLCQLNQLTWLDIGGCSALTRLDCHDNQLPWLDVTECNKLNHLDCHLNQLTSLDVTKCGELQELDCSENPNLSILKIKRGTCTVRLNYSETKIMDGDDIDWDPPYLAPLK